MQISSAYIRVSTEEQAEFSLDSQLKAIQAYANQHNMTLPEEFIFIDEGISGRLTKNRPAFNRMIATAKTSPKPFDIILVWKFSRFARNRQDSIVYKSMLRKQYEIDVISVSEQIGNNNTSILIEALIEAMDEYYSLNLAEEVRRGMKEKFSRGGIVSQPPFGYRMRDNNFVPDEKNAPIVKLIYNDYISGMGVRQIAQKLNSMGITSKKGNPFENRTVEYILTNPVYIGKLRRSTNSSHDRFYENNVEYVTSDYEHIISDEIFQKVQEKRKQNKKLYGKYSRQESVGFMLKGLVKCSDCGATLVLSSKKNMLQCHRYSKGMCNVSHGIVLKKINSVVTDKIKNDFLKYEFDISIMEFHEPQKDYINIIENEKKKLLRIKEAYQSGIDTLEEYRINKLKITSKIKELEKNLLSDSEQEEKSEKDFPDKVKTSINIIENTNMTETAKNLILRAFVDKIVYNKKSNLIEIFYKI